MGYTSSRKNPERNSGDSPNHISLLALCTTHFRARPGLSACMRVSRLRGARSTKDPGQQAHKYKAGAGEVIVGWDQGCLGMQVCECERERERERE